MLQGLEVRGLHLVKIIEVSDPWPGDLLLLHADGLHTVILGLSEAVKVAKNS